MYFYTIIISVCFCDLRSIFWCISKVPLIQFSPITMQVFFYKMLIRDIPVLTRKAGMWQVISAYNPLWPSDAIWHHKAWSILVRLMACCLTAPSHYINQCSLTICGTCGIHLRAISLETLEIQWGQWGQCIRVNVGNYYNVCHFMLQMAVLCWDFTVIFPIICYLVCGII